MNEYKLKEKDEWKTWKVWVIAALLVLVLVYGIYFVGATMYAGNTYTYDTDIKEMYWEVEGNSSNLEGLNISYINNQIILEFDLLFQPDNFTLTFYDAYTDEEIIDYGGGDGGSGGHWVYNNPIVNETIEDKTKETQKNETDVPEEIEEFEKSNEWIFYLIVGVIVLLIITIISVLSRKKEADFQIPKMEELDEKEVNEDEEII